MCRMEVVGAEDDATLDERDQRILAATEQLIAELGYDRVRLIDVADRSGVSVGSLQHRYRTRDALMRRAAERVATFQIPHFTEIEEAGSDPYDRLLALITRSVLLGNPMEPASLPWLELVLVSSRNDEVKEVISDADQVWRSAFRDVFDEGLLAGRFSSQLDADQLSLVFIALIDGFGFRKLLGPAADVDELKETALTVLWSVVRVHDVDQPKVTT
jgi:AcrR family transcriptional regulator